MAPLSYLLLPITGMVSYFFGRTARVRFHGLQAVLLGIVWPLALLGASQIDPSVTRATFGLGAALWLMLLIGTAAGRDPTLPGLGSPLRRLSQSSPRSA